MGALMGLLLDANLTGYTLAPDGPAVPGETVDVLISWHRRLPRDHPGAGDGVRGPGHLR
jgi:hypothetical protein